MEREREEGEGGRVDMEGQSADGGLLPEERLRRPGGSEGEAAG